MKLLTTSSPDSEAEPEPSDASVDARAELCGRLGYSFGDPGLLDLALRHRSWCAEHGGVQSNERLEFLGDSVLGLVVTERLYRDDPETSEGVLARRRSELVSAVALAGVGRQIGLGDAVALGKGEETTGGRSKTSILSDALEAVIGAVFIDGGMDAATGVVLRLFDERIDVVTSGGPGSDHKSRLQELSAQEFGELPRYELTEDGPEHMKTFRAEVSVAGVVRGTGEGRTKKEAEQAAALEACGVLGDEVSGGPEADDDNTRSGAATGTGGDHG